MLIDNFSYRGIVNRTQVKHDMLRWLVHSARFRCTGERGSAGLDDWPGNDRTRPVMMTES